MSTPNLPMLTAAVLALAAALAMARLWRYRASRSTRRTVLLLCIQPVLAVLLFFGLFPPMQPLQAGDTLVVLTAGWRDGPAIDPTQAGAIRIALPEALPETLPAVGAERSPDLATALRRYPNTVNLHIQGHGLTPRDRTAARGYTITFQPPALPAGLAELAYPVQLASGNPLPVSGRVTGMPGGQVELLDPALQRVQRSPLGRDGRFTLLAEVRSAGLLAFTLRVLDANGKLHTAVPLPIDVQQPAPLRLLVVAGAPNPELKYLRRWAKDAGIQLHTQIDAGNGIQLGDAPLPLTAATFEKFDALLLDARSLQALRPADWQALNAAIATGLGVLVQLDAMPTQALRSRLRVWGFGIGLAQATAPQPVRLPTDAASQTALVQGWVLQNNSSVVAPLLRGPQGQALAQWRAVGQGRVGVLGLTETYPLVLQGRSAAHAQLWSALFAPLARPMQETLPTLPAPPLWAGEHADICQLTAHSQLLGADGRAIPLPIDPATGAQRCAAFWPSQPGWYVLRTGTAQQWLHVWAAAIAPVVRLQQRQQATRVLAIQNLALQKTGAAAVRTTSATPTQRSAAWPWLAAWLLLLVVSWLTERRGRTSPATDHAN
jgi:hypothetical protein